RLAMNLLVKSRLWAALLLLASCLTMVGPALAQRIDVTAVQNRYLEYYRKGDYARALAEAHKLEGAVRRLVGTDHPNYAIVQEFIGNSNRGLGRLQEADAAHKRALALRQRLYGENSTQVADSLNNVGSTALGMGRHGDAIAAF